jgi:hypothetical protein
MRKSVGRMPYAQRLGTKCTLAHSHSRSNSRNVSIIPTPCAPPIPLFLSAPDRGVPHPLRRARPLFLALGAKGGLLKPTTSPAQVLQND